MPGAITTNAIRGDRSRMGYENSDHSVPDPYGTALDLTSYVDARICVTVSPNFVAEELDFNLIGCGGQSGFGTDCELENFEYRATIAGDAGYQNGYMRVLAQFMGASSAPVEQTLGEDDNLHTLTFSSIANDHFGTFAYETTQDDVIELISTFTESMTMNMTAGSQLTWTATLTANDVECDIAAAVNTNADLRSLTFESDEKMIGRCETAFRIAIMNDDGADIALVAGDLVPVISVELDMERPLEVIAEATGGDCNAPTQAGALEGSLTVTFKQHTQNETLSYLNWKAGDFYQADMTVTGNPINAGVDAEHVMRWPKLCLIEAPSYDVTDEGFNQYTLVFRLLDSNNILPGFSTNALEADVINRRSGVYLIT